ncbi:hypothetical protein DFH07DRAFT_565748 [Mycena maculata]|uniref:BAG domain-containing protein n=1 Tax=Mycena maculata TaxID=230809 RepID=A0AAD7N6B7_9AGAR|nr:hypothetical protein DFH07DRAFT_565748 [Mycena maculata]
MFHSTLSPRTTNPREKYLAALAEAKAAEAEYLAAERLQQEEDSLRQRLEQIQLLKHTPRPDFGSYYTPSQYPQPAPLSYAPDLELLRRQVAAEERARILQEQQEARELEALKQLRARELEAQHRQEQQVRVRLHEARKAQLARDSERTRSLAAQRARLEALTQQASAPTVRFVLGGEDAAPSPRRDHCRPRPEFRNTLDLTPFLGAAARKPQAPTPAAVDPTEILQALFGAPKAQKVRTASIRRSGCPNRNPIVQESLAPAPQAVSLEQFLSHLLGAQSSTVAPQPQPAPQQPAKEAAPQAVRLEKFLDHLLGTQASTSTAAPQPKAPEEPAKEAAQAPVSLEQLLSHFLGAAGFEVQQPQPSTSSAAPAPSTSAAPEPKMEAAPAPSQSAPIPAAAPKPAEQPSTPQAVGLDHILNQFLGGGASNQVDVQQLMNMFLGGHGLAHADTPKAPESSSSKSASSLKEELLARARTEPSSEEHDLAEAIRMSLAEPAPAPASPSSDGKGKAPAPAPVADVASSTAEVQAIDAAFTALAADFAFPAALDFRTSRTPSPTRSGEEAAVSAVARLSYSARNHEVRMQHQALSALLGRLDAVESFGDEALRHARKEAVGRVEGALDELERVIEARWRKWAGKEERAAPTSAPAHSAAEPASAVEAEDEALVVVAVEDTQEAPVEAVEAEPVADTTTAAPEAAESAPEPSTIPEPEPIETSNPPATESSYPPTADVVSESVETIRPTDIASPATSDIDTFLLPAASDAQPPKKPAAAEEDVGSDWSEVDA